MASWGWYLLLVVLNMQGVASQLFSVTTSRPFDMLLSPSTVAPTIATTSKLELKMRSAIILSASITSNFVSASDIDIVLQEVVWSAEELSTWVRFEASASFFQEDLNGSSAPSQFAFDSLIVRTFSQPSSKATFITSLGSAQDVALDNVTDVTIQLVPPTGSPTAGPTAEPLMAPATPGQSQSKSRLSNLDIFLIVASLLMLCFVIYVLYKQRESWKKFEARKDQITHGRTPKTIMSNPSPNPDKHKTAVDFGDTTGTQQVSDKQSWQDIISASVEGFDEEYSRSSSSNVSPPTIAESLSGNGVRMVHESNIVSPSTSSDEYIMSPPLSACSSMRSSSSSNSNNDATTTSSLSRVSHGKFFAATTTAGSPISQCRSTNFLLGAAQPEYRPSTNDANSSSSSSGLSPLTARLLRLPMIGPPIQDKVKQLRSIASAPANLEMLPTQQHNELPTQQHNANDTLSVEEDVSIQSAAQSIRSYGSSTTDETSIKSTASSLYSGRSTGHDDPSIQSVRSIKSVRSVRSGCSLSSRGRLRMIAPIPEHEIPHDASNVTDHGVTSNHSRLSTHFEKDWAESRRKAVENDDESSYDDVFHVDVDAHSSVDDNRSKMSGLSAVSDWMKRVCVVNASSSNDIDKAADDTSPEQSSVEVSTEESAVGDVSVSGSLEQSMAGSLVEV